jgi:hypothetical protein
LAKPFASHLLKKKKFWSEFPARILESYAKAKVHKFFFFLNCKIYCNASEKSSSKRRL